MSTNAGALSGMFRGRILVYRNGDWYDKVLGELKRRYREFKEPERKRRVEKLQEMGLKSQNPFEPL